GEGLDQALDVRVLAGIGSQAQPGRDLGVGGGELAGQPADVGQLPVVVGQQGIAHGSTPLTSKAPVAGFRVESKTIGSGAGSAISRASMRKRRVRSSGSGLPRICTSTLLNRGSPWRMTVWRISQMAARSWASPRPAPEKSG